MGKKSKRSGRPAASHPPPPVHVLHNKEVCKLVDELWESETITHIHKIHTHTHTHTTHTHTTHTHTHTHTYTHARWYQNVLLSLLQSPCIFKKLKWARTVVRMVSVYCLGGSPTKSHSCYNYTYCTCVAMYVHVSMP